MRDNFASLMLEKHMVDWDVYYPRGYQYMFPRSTLVGQVSVDAVLQIQQDAPFLITGYVSQVTTDDTDYPSYNTALYVPDVDVFLFDSGASTFLSNSPVPLSVLAGNGGQNRYDASVPYLVEQNTNIKATFTNRGTDTKTVDLALFGYKIIKRLTPVSNGQQKIRQAFEQLNRAERNAIIQSLAAMR